jgi:hypothetical protein
MKKILELGRSTLLAALALPLITQAANAASYEHCLLGYRMVKSPAYSKRLQQGAAAKAAACPDGWEAKYGDDDGAMMSDPCYGDPKVCAEPMGLVDTRTECGEVSSSKLGTAAQIKEAARIFQELQQSTICHYAQ